MIKPDRLKKGDKIGVVAPASPVFEKDKIDMGVKMLKEQGFDVVLGDSCFKKYGFLAGNDYIRAKDINDFFKNDEIDAIICLRGGYGSIRILDMIDYETIKNNPKIFCGYSDITAFHLAIYKYTSLITFHGPMICDIAEFDEFTIKSFIDCLSGNINDKSYSLGILRGKDKDVEGRIFGGNLSLICSLIGTPYENNYENKILFIEDIGEEPYKVDRMLNHLRLRGVFENIKAIILGQFTDCSPKDEEKSLSLNIVFEDFFSNIKVPVYYGLLAGHDKNKITIPLNTNIKIIGDKLYFIEEGVK
ncbi:muramoyltetrapeptide carboxypeptidase [Caloramator quimbayensis]|uniref:Muramoyltetrapeptide carboxypeptidase n=1 Tax=Caloramator quimbayensis TaxID=1147123 RepID=A0A1T4XAS5_9CLOT|nr:LD-carboxypeptidase [Caloramator quimbayensis]SKA86537.1 muramoyltetrapeptide carboxypeptidase [Caloramator quimbayensis]